MFQRRPAQHRRNVAMEMFDMYGNVNDILSLYQQMKSDPRQMLSKKYNFPQDMNNPQDIIQHLLNTGQVSQAQVNNIMNMRNNPLFQMLMRK